MIYILFTYLKFSSLCPSSITGPSSFVIQLKYNFLCVWADGRFQLSAILNWIRVISPSSGHNFISWSILELSLFARPRVRAPPPYLSRSPLNPGQVSHPCGDNRMDSHSDRAKGTDECAPKLIPPNLFFWC